MNKRELSLERIITFANKNSGFIGLLNFVFAVLSWMAGKGILGTILACVAIISIVWTVVRYNRNKDENQKENNLDENIVVSEKNTTIEAAVMSDELTDQETEHQAFKQFALDYRWQTARKDRVKAISEKEISEIMEESFK